MRFANRVQVHKNSPATRLEDEQQENKMDYTCILAYMHRVMYEAIVNDI